MRVMRISLLIVLSVGSLAGCGSRPSAPESSAEGQPQVAAPLHSESPVTRPIPPANSAPPAAQSELATTASPLRSLLAQYLESDGHGGWRKNEKAATELEKLSPADAHAAWSLLRDQDVQVRRAAAVFLLPQFDPSNSEQVAAYHATLSDTDRMVRARGIDAARQFLAVDQLKALPELTALLDPRREDRPENRAAAARLIGSLKQGATGALTVVLAAVQTDPDAKVRAAALGAAASISSTSPVIETLGKALTDQDAAVRLAAASRLRQLGSAARPVAPALSAALGDASSEVAEAAAEALIRIGPAAVEPLSKELASNQVEARKLALAALIKIGPPAKSARIAIEKCLHDSDAQVRLLAETALKRLSPP